MGSPAGPLPRPLQDSPLLPPPGLREKRRSPDQTAGPAPRPHPREDQQGNVGPLRRPGRPQPSEGRYPEALQRGNSSLRQELVNSTEKRAVLHTCLRAPIDSAIHPESLSNTLKDVHEVLASIEQFSNKVRSGEHKGATGKDLKNLVVIGIGGSYLSIEFVFEALRSHPAYEAASKGRKLRFLANVDPIDLHRSVQDLDV